MEDEARRAEIVVVVREIGDQPPGQQRPGRAPWSIGRDRAGRRRCAKVVWLMPSARARSVIICANRSSLPPSSSPSAAAASFADSVTMPRIACSTVSGSSRHQAELGRLHRRGVRRDRNLFVERDAPVAQRLERHVERHQLGQAGRMARGVGVVFLQHLAAGGVDDDGGVPVDAGPEPTARRRCSGRQPRPIRTTMHRRKRTHESANHCASSKLPFYCPSPASFGHPSAGSSSLSSHEITRLERQLNGLTADSASVSLNQVGDACCACTKSA